MPTRSEPASRWITPRARYLKLVRSKAAFSFGGLRLALDCANGAAYQAAPELFTMLKADVAVHFAEPTGMNINEACGATVPGALAAVADGRIGLCFDGDADRLIVVDEDGEVANGDVIMAIIAKHLKARSELKNNLVVTTVMANLGFRQAMAGADIDMIETRVGDRYVLEAMLQHKASLGGRAVGSRDPARPRENGGRSPDSSPAARGCRIHRSRDQGFAQGRHGRIPAGTQECPCRIQEWSGPRRKACGMPSVLQRTSWVTRVGCWCVRRGPSRSFG